MTVKHKRMLATFIMMLAIIGVVLALIDGPKEFLEFFGLAFAMIAMMIFAAAIMWAVDTLLTWRDK